MHAFTTHLTVLPINSDSGVIFVYKFIRDLKSIDYMCINPILRIGLIHKRSIDSRLLKWSVQVTVMFHLTIVNKKITSLSLLVGITVDVNIFQEEKRNG